MSDKVEFYTRDLEGALVVATEAGIAACVRDLARAVAREEIEKEAEMFADLVLGVIRKKLHPDEQETYERYADEKGREIARIMDGESDEFGPVGDEELEAARVPLRAMSTCEHCACEAGYDLESRCDVCRKHRRPHHMNKEANPPAPSEGAEDTEGLEVVGYLAGTRHGGATVTRPGDVSELRKFSGAIPLVRLSDAVERIRAVRKVIASEENDRLTARLEAVERERDGLRRKLQHERNALAKACSQLDEVDALRQRLEESEGSEGEVEPVAWRRWEKWEGGDHEGWIFYGERAWQNCEPLYSHGTVQRLRRERNEAHRVASGLDNDVDGYRGLIDRHLSRIRRLEAEIARLRDPGGEGVARIARERRRQMEEEGWSPEHDAAHDECEIARAGESYLSAYLEREATGKVRSWPADWPWEPSWWKPKDPIRDLERAGALIAAEIDRLLRVGPPETQEDDDG